MNEAFHALLGMTTFDVKGKRLEKYIEEMTKIYDGFETKPVGEQSLTRIMMKTVKTAVNVAKAEFGEEAFPIIRALMYLDGLVIRTHPEVVLINQWSLILMNLKPIYNFKKYTNLSIKKVVMLMEESSSSDVIIVGAGLVALQHLFIGTLRT